MKKNCFSRISVFVFAIMVLATACSKVQMPQYQKNTESFQFCFDKSTVSNDQNTLNEQLLRLTLVAESSILRLYADESNANVVVEDKRSGKLWSAIPMDLESDAVATDEMKTIMRSTVRITYYDNGSLQTMYSYPDCVENEGHSMEEIDNGVRFTFNMSSGQITFADLPLKLNDERFKKFFVDNPGLTEVDKKRINKYFEYSEDEKVWVRVAENDTVLRSLYDIMQRVGYTEEELKTDFKENGIPYTGGTRIFFNLNIEYTIQNDSLLVNVPLEGIKYNPNFPPVTITFNELLLSDSGNNGYLFVPDGSGAIIHFSENPDDKGSYTLPVYGEDQSINNLDIPAKSIPSLMPVFGVSCGKSGALAIIEDGDAFSYITAYKAGTLNSYNTVYCEFNTIRSSSASIGDGSLTSLVHVFQKQIYKGSLRIRYIMLNGKTDYAAMAVCYRQYRMERDRLEFSKLQDAQLHLELIGGIEAANSVLGFQYKGIKSLTTFEQALEIIQELKSSGVNDIQLKYSGILEGGLDHHALSNPKLIGKLGSEKELHNLSQLLSQNLYLGVSALTVSEGGNGFSQYKHAARTLDQAIARSYLADIVTGEKEDPRYIVSSAYLPQYLSAFLSKLKKLQLNRIAFDDLGGKLFGDYNQNACLSRQDSKQIALLALKKSMEESAGLMLTKPFVDAASYAQAINQIPLYSNQVPVISRSVPFLPITLSGLVPYSGEPYNSADDRDVIRLKMIETGAMPGFVLFAESNTVLRNTKYIYMTSNQYSAWREDIKWLYNECKYLFSKTEGSPIVGHQEVLPGVYMTVYENGVEVLTNYNEKPVVWDGSEIKGMNYIVKG